MCLGSQTNLCMRFVDSIRLLQTIATMRLPPAHCLLQSGRFDILFFVFKSNFIGSKIQNTIFGEREKRKSHKIRASKIGFAWLACIFTTETTTTTNNNRTPCIRFTDASLEMHAAINFDIAKIARPFRRRRWRCEWILKSCQAFSEGVILTWHVAWVCDCARPWQPPHAVWHIRLFSLRQSTASQPKSLFACTSFGWNVVRECVLNSSVLLFRNVSWVRQNRIFGFSIVLRCTAVHPSRSRSLSNVKLNYSNAVTNVRCHFFRHLIRLFPSQWICPLISSTHGTFRNATKLTSL